MASKATSGVCSAGFATTQLPAASAAAICPVKIASGKFHGLMQTNTPRPRMRSSLDSPVGPGSGLRRKHTARVLRVVTGNSPTASRTSETQSSIVLPASLCSSAIKPATILLKQVARAFKRGGALGDGSSNSTPGKQPVRMPSQRQPEPHRLPAQRR